jgi:hypothetical protein
VDKPVDKVWVNYFAIYSDIEVFLPTSKIIFGVLGFASGFVNWGVAFLVGLAFLVRWAYPRLREFAEDS